MLEININDVINIINLCAPYLIAFGVLFVIGIIVMIACKKMAQNKKYVIRRQAWMAILLSLIIVVNLICYGPLSTMITLATGDGTISEESGAKAEALGVEVAEEGIVLLENKDNLLPLKDNKQINVFGWSSTNPVYGGTGSGALSDTYPVVGLLEGLTNSGFELNTELSDFYSAYRADRPVVGLVEQDWTLPEPAVDTYSDELINNAKAFSDTAMIVISRVGGEGADLPTDVNSVTYENNSTSYNDFEDGQHYLELSKSERDMIELVTSNFENVVLVYNAANAFELGFVEEFEQIKSVLWCPGTGQNGFIALGEILNGEVNPSGKTADTFVYDLTSTPYYNNIGDFTYSNMDDLKPAATEYTDGSVTFVNYVEGIYVGYKFYETAAAEGLINYDETVKYPFGYGLSYTTFQKEMGDLNISDDGSISVDVTVTNTGDVEGKDIVELYYTPPYTNGGIEKSEVNIIAFDKTDLLAPGETQELTLTFNAEDMASYDTYREGSWVLEAGQYNISLRSDSHTVIDSKVYEVGEKIVYGEDNKRSTDEVAAVNQFEFAEGNVTYLSRADGFANYSEAIAAPASLEMAEEFKELFKNDSNYNPEDYNNPDDEMPVTGARNGLELLDLRGLDYDDELWEDLLDQLTVNEMVNMIGLGGYQTSEAKSVGKVATLDVDGPAALINNFTGVGSIGLPTAVMVANSWNEDLAFSFGEIIGEMANDMEVSGWYAPAINTHRSAFAGRNFEYYSEDGLLSGKLAANIVSGTNTKGVYAYVKHFALNDQENNRWRMLATWSNEQAIREIYLKPFEITVKEGDAKAIMSAYNYIGTKWAGASSELLNTVLRDEWGFEGMVLTDYFGGFGYMDADIAIRNGNDIALIAYDVGGNMITDTSSATSIKAMRQSSKNIMYTIVNSRAYADGVIDMGMRGWQIAGIVIDVILGLGFIGLEVLIFRKYNKKYKNNSEIETDISASDNV